MLSALIAICTISTVMSTLSINGVWVNVEGRNVPFNLEVVDKRDRYIGVPLRAACPVIVKVIPVNGVDSVIRPNRSETSRASERLFSPYKKFYLSIHNSLIHKFHATTSEKFETLIHTFSNMKQ